jgi:predicted adenine nucleotide alpha hydrolase (AANH) superfamily ATPase
MDRQKRKILLHACCAPDAAVVVERLANDFDVSVVFYNPNIHPQEEYRLRLEEMRLVAECMGAGLVESDYDVDRWFELTRGLEHEPEKGKRCDVCFEMRLRQTAQTAVHKGFDLFGTVLTVSPHKDAGKINEIGRRLGNEIGVEFLEADFKKKDGFKRSIELSRQFDLYRQDYCGCIHSRREREHRNQTKGKAEEGR